MPSAPAPRSPTSLSPQPLAATSTQQTNNVEALIVKTEPLSDNENASPASTMPPSGNASRPAGAGPKAAQRTATHPNPGRGGRGGAARSSLGRGGGTGRPASVTPVVAAIAVTNPTEPAKTPSRKRKKAVEEADKPPPPTARPWVVEKDHKRRFTNTDLTLLESGEFADAKVICEGGKEWLVHKTILCPRSKWFAQALKPDAEGGQTNIVNLHKLPEDHVETLLKFIYSGSLDINTFGLANGTFFMYASLFNLAQAFELENLADDALSLLGQFCDIKLKSLCSLDPVEPGHTGVAGDASDPSSYIDDLLKATWKAYEVDVGNHGTALQALLATFVYAGRNRLFQCEGFREISNTIPMFGNAIFKLMLGTVGEQDPKFAPKPEAVREVSSGLDHTHKSQHPDRCAHCHGVFDNKTLKKGMYNPFVAVVRPSTYCLPCVDKNANVAVPLWRQEPLTTKEGKENREKE
ncbi:hypothetical protein B0T14DRAFT_554280 [Immersiella caudata]|uniref:BTB domain-containing protein n=1 Tax=Immersiella caudata TaxID=314043 RepID=A0AA39WZK2_9PEZI|nr:hypothetical protein B0T14DRAFT_554280 [Immersiella caudata]